MNVTSNEIEHGHGHSHEHAHEHTHDGAPHNHEHTHEHAHDHDEHSHAHDSLHDNAQGNDHQHEHSHSVDERETFALIRYMLSHNRQHADELKGLAEKLSDMGKIEAADVLSEAISSFEKGNSQLERVVSLIEE